MTSPTQVKPVRLFNSASREVEELSPMSPGQVGIYCCGPTVYNYQHIGNLRTYVFEDLLVRTLRYAGYDVNHVMNITDVGHLVSDADEGEDKMAVAAKREGKRSEELAEYYTTIFLEHCSWLHITRPTTICKATEHIEQMIALIKRLEEKGVAYQSGGNVYFDVAQFEQYGDFARLPLEQLKAGARIDVDDKKRNPLDFALWFTKSKFENQELQWESPWGRGYPGWHIECSAMAIHYLGESFDIHCGGIDHIPVHHTNEIAQSECATGKRFANVWMHGGFLVLGKDKMSKSTGEFLTLDLVKEKGFDPIAYRLFCLSGSYRNELSWSWQGLEAAQNSLRKIKETVLSWKSEGASVSSSFSTAALEIIERFEAAILNDLGMPNALAVLHEVLGNKQLSITEKLSLVTHFDSVFALGVADWQVVAEEIPQEILDLAQSRATARSSRNFAEADRFRQLINDAGFEIEDAPGGAFRVKRR